MTNLIFLQTVLEEAANRSKKVTICSVFVVSPLTPACSSQVLERLRKLLRDPSHSYFVFANEHHRSTFVESLPAGESIK